MAKQIRFLRPVKIRKIERRSCNKSVYNLAVEEDESYVAENVVVHNCRTIEVFITTDDLPVRWSTEAELDSVLRLIPEGFK